MPMCKKPARRGFRCGRSIRSARSLRKTPLIPGLAVALVFVAATTILADFQNPLITAPSNRPTAAVDVDAASKAIPEVDKAIKSFESREFDASLKLLTEAVKKWVGNFPADPAPPTERTGTPPHLRV